MVSLLRNSITSCAFAKAALRSSQSEELLVRGNADLEAMRELSLCLAAERLSSCRKLSATILRRHAPQ